MHLLDQRILGGAILLLLGVLVGVKRFATGSIFDKPEGNSLVQLVNTFNLFFLLVVNPLAAILLITRQLAAIDPSHVTINDPSILMISELAGLAVYAFGYFLMAWALSTLGRIYLCFAKIPADRFFESPGLSLPSRRLSLNAKSNRTRGSDAPEPACAGRMRLQHSPGMVGTAVWEQRLCGTGIVRSVATSLPRPLSHADGRLILQRLVLPAVSGGYRQTSLPMKSANV